MNQPITFGSVCSGIEAASVAWGPLGWRAAWLSEIEPFPCAVLAHHYPDVPNLGDMTKIAPLIRDGFVPAPDVFCGGTPCQAFSVAGLRNSLDDARGNLSLTFCEIANEIDTRRAADGLLPTVVFWENVPGVLSTKDNAFGCFLAGLAGEDDPLVSAGVKWTNAGCVLGPKRTVAWRVTDAQHFGVAQRRRRVFVIASAREGFDPAAVLFEFDGVRRDSPPRREPGKDITHDLAPCLTSSGRGVERGGDTRGQDPVVAVALRGREGGATAELGDVVAGCLRASTGGGDKPHVLAPVAHAFDARQSDVIQYGDITGPLDTDGHTIGVMTPAVAFSCKDYGGDAAVEVAPTMRAMGHSGSHANAGGQLAVCVTGDITHTLKAEGFDASEDGTGRGQPIVAAWAIGSHAGAADGDQTNRSHAGGGPVGSNISEELAYSLRAGRTQSVATTMAVRRLTPRECERLQAFPDDYTLIPYGRVVRIEKLEKDWIKYLLRGGVMTFDQVCKAAADGPRYKALGNSWAVPNVRRIGARIDRALRASTGSINTPQQR